MMQAEDRRTFPPPEQYSDIALLQIHGLSFSPLSAGVELSAVAVVLEARAKVYDNMNTSGSSSRLPSDSSPVCKVRS